MKVLDSHNLYQLFYKRIAELNIDIFCEVGAYAAESSKLLSLNKNIESFAYEANPFVFEQHKESVGMERVNYYRMAISDKVGKLDFQIMKGYELSGANSLHKRTMTREGNGNLIEYVPITVDCSTLDELHKPVKNKSFGLWIDVEGASWSVLQGAHEVLSNTKIIIIEVEDHKFWVNQKGSNDIINFLEGYGFEAVARDEEYPNQYNIILEKL